MNVKRLLWESKLAVALVLLIAARCVDRVLYTRITYDYTTFLWYFSNIILPLAFLVTSWPVVWFKMYFTEDITDEMRRFPHYKFAIMALLDQLSILLSSFPTPHIGGNLANVLGQLSLPGQDSANMPDPTAGWILLYIVSLVPSAASNVYKEMGLKDTDLDICGWVSFYQLVFGLMSVWTVRIKAFSDPPVPWSEFLPYVGKAHRCFFGEAVELNGQHVPCDAGIFEVFLLFMVFNKVYNILTLYIFKEGSSVLFVVSSAAFTIYDGFALFVLVMGLLVYHSEKEVRQVDAHKSYEKSPMYASPTLQKTHLMKKKRGKLLYRQSPNPAQRLIRRDSAGKPKFYGATGAERPSEA
ncbi:hypothetical protein PybrP1_006233 [[Pythium] brassicae (nom. inval.)]|nr:hypothetical protein PybrP1_006233 [[Pythium] brassicae (nom. inval.)]